MLLEPIVTYIDGNEDGIWILTVFVQAQVGPLCSHIRE